MFNVRKEISKRLTYEFKRRGLTPPQVCNIASLPLEVVNGYLNGTRELLFKEITKICSGLGINPVRLVYNESYPKSKLAFRQVDIEIQNLAAKVEDVFLLIADMLPVINIPKYSRTSGEINERGLIIMEAVAFSNEIRSEYKTPEDFIDHYAIPIFPIKSNKAEFDAFLVSSKKHAGICINTAKPPHRIRYSLAHEIAHLIFDRENDVPVDTFPPDFYWKKNFTKAELPEYFAHKFSEFYLIPYEEAFNAAKTWPNLDIQTCHNLIEKYDTSKDVLANALYDILIYNENILQNKSQQIEMDGWSEDEFRQRYGDEFSTDQETVRFKEIQRALISISSSQSAIGIFAFLEKCKTRLSEMIGSQSDSFSDEIFSHISEVLQIG